MPDILGDRFDTPLGDLYSRGSELPGKWGRMYQEQVVGRGVNPDAAMAAILAQMQEEQEAAQRRLGLQQLTPPPLLGKPENAEDRYMRTVTNSFLQ